jgi:hypothetical protein
VGTDRGRRAAAEVGDVAAVHNPDDDEVGPIRFVERRRFISMGAVPFAEGVEFAFHPLELVGQRFELLPLRVHRSGQLVERRSVRPPRVRWRIGVRWGGVRARG